MKMNYAAPIIDGYNAVTGAIVAVLSYILGEHWILFVAFLLLNCSRLDHRMDEEPHGRKRKLQRRMERRSEEVGILADDHGSIRSQRCIY